jgi:hypothetical protein
MHLPHCGERALVRAVLDTLAQRDFDPQQFSRNPLRLERLGSSPEPQTTRGARGIHPTSQTNPARQTPDFLRINAQSPRRQDLTFPSPTSFADEGSLTSHAQPRA